MSTVTYAALTARRKQSVVVEAGDTKRNLPPGIGVWADSFAALVPAEVLLFHAYTKPWFMADTVITHPGRAWLVLIGSLVLCVILYVGGLWVQGARTSRLFNLWGDGWRLVAVVLALVCWMIAQESSALDVVFVLPPWPRAIAVPILAVGLTICAGFLGGNGADEVDPDTL